MSRTRAALVGVVAAGLMLMSAGAASASTVSETKFDNISLGNNWWLESPTEISTDVTSTSETESRNSAFSSYTAQIQQPINPNGSSTWPAKRGVLPVQFKLTAAPTTETRTVTTTTKAVTKVPSFKSIGSDGFDMGNWGAADFNDASVLSNVPLTSTTVADIDELRAGFVYAPGSESHGGSLRWQIETPDGNINVYYGDADPGHKWTGQGGSGMNLVEQTDDRFETMQLDGVFYHTWAEVEAKFGANPVTAVRLIVDSGWQSDQVIDLLSADVNGSHVDIADSYAGAEDVDDFGVWKPGPSKVTSDAATAQWVAGPPGTPVQTNAIPAKLVVKKFNDGNGYEVVNETLSSAQGDNSGWFRQIDSKYMYNLKIESLTGPGDYKVYLDVNGDGILEETPGVFSLK